MLSQSYRSFCKKGAVWGITLGLTMSHPDSLNPAQRDAVLHEDGPLLILAGAGSGKTRVITYRLTELLRRGVPAQRLLVVTFTNKAAAELRHRVEQLLLADRLPGAPYPELPRWIGTFHSIGARLLRALASYAKLPQSFVILDEDDQLKICKELLAEAQIDERMLPPRALRAHIDRAKNQGLLADEFTGTDYFSDLVRKLYKRYEERLLHIGAADFGDLLLLPVRIAEREELVRVQLAHRFAHVLVDEFQDVNAVQYRLLKILAGRSRNLAVVGDDDQAIYGWRGADVRLLLDFQSDWPDARIVKLEENYRSSQVILDAAHAVVSRNEDRHDKRLYTRRDGGDPIVFFRARDDRAEARYVAETILRMQAEEGFFPEDFAVIYRTNAQSLRFEEALQTLGLPFSLLGGMRFFERAEIKDVLAYLRLCQNPEDELALRRVINVPARQIGQTTVDKLLAQARAGGLSLWQVVVTTARGGGLLTKKKQKDLLGFVTLIEELSARAQDLTVSTLTAEVLDRTGYRLMLSTSNPEDETRIENLDALLGSIAEEERLALEAVAQQSAHKPDEDDAALLLWEAPKPLTLGDYLSRVALATDEESNQRGKGVQLMTAHVAKGLEFQVVFVTGLEESLFPSLRAGSPSLRDNEDTRIVEERRLAYVALTRARSRLYLTCARQRRLWGPEIRPMEVSRFVHAIPRGLLVGSLDGEPSDRGYHGGWQPAPSLHKSERAPEPDDGSLRIVRDEEEAGPRPRRAPSATSDGIRQRASDHDGSPEVSRVRAQLADRFSDLNRKDDSGPLRTHREVEVEYDSDIPPRPGQPVRHASLGRGRLVAVSLGGREPIATVRFDSGALKQIAMRFLTMLGRDDAGDPEGA